MCDQLIADDSVDMLETLSLLRLGVCFAPLRGRETPIKSLRRVLLDVVSRPAVCVECLH